MKQIDFRSYIFQTKKHCRVAITTCNLHLQQSRIVLSRKTNHKAVRIIEGVNIHILEKDMSKFQVTLSKPVKYIALEMSEVHVTKRMRENEDTKHTKTHVKHFCIINYATNKVNTLH